MKIEVFVGEKIEDLGMESIISGVVEEESCVEMCRPLAALRLRLKQPHARHERGAQQPPRTKAKAKATAMSNLHCVCMWPPRSDDLSTCHPMSHPRCCRKEALASSLSTFEPCPNTFRWPARGTLFPAFCPFTPLFCSLPNDCSPGISAGTRQGRHCVEAAALLFMPCASHLIVTFLLALLIPHRASRHLIHLFRLFHFSSHFSIPFAFSRLEHCTHSLRRPFILIVG